MSIPFTSNLQSRVGLVFNHFSRRREYYFQKWTHAKNLLHISWVPDGNPRGEVERKGDDRAPWQKETKRSTMEEKI